MAALSCARVTPPCERSTASRVQPLHMLHCLRFGSCWAKHALLHKLASPPAARHCTLVSFASQLSACQLRLTQICCSIKTPQHPLIGHHQSGRALICSATSTTGLQCLASRYLTWFAGLLAMFAWPTVPFMLKPDWHFLWTCLQLGLQADSLPCMAQRCAPSLGAPLRSMPLQYWDANACCSTHSDLGMLAALPLAAQSAVDSEGSLGCSLALVAGHIAPG